MRSREIKGILETVRPVRGERVILFLTPGPDRVAAIAGKRVGGAVQRNRARRVLRAAWQQAAQAARGRDAVLVARAPIVGAKSQDLVDEMTELLSGNERP
ncbi:MAG: ribonuclease P protein component [Actinomycetota bacterium]